MAFLAVASGLGVGLVGGLIGLGGAEFRLPILVAVFGYALRRAVVLNLIVSFVTVLAGAGMRLALGETRRLPDDAGAILASMIGGGMVGAYLGAAGVARLPDAGLRRLVRGLLLMIGALLLIESGVAWQAPGLRLGPVGRSALAVAAGGLIGSPARCSASPAVS